MKKERSKFMNINIINNTAYSAIKVICNGKDFLLEKDKSVSLNTDTNIITLKVSVLEKNKVILNFLYMLINGFDESGVINSLKCNAAFDFQLSENDNIITIEQVEARNDKQGFIYESVYLKNDENTIAATDYKLTDTEKQRKKSMFFLIFVTSWLPLFIVLFCIFLVELFKEYTFSPLTCILILLFFTIPSWKKAARLKMYYDSQYANTLLFEEVQKIRQNIQNVPNDFVNKAVYKTLDKIFKKNRKN